MEINIISGNICIRANLRDTATAKAIANALPISSKAQTWGKEVYFSVPVSARLEAEAKDMVDERMRMLMSLSTFTFVIFYYNRGSYSLIFFSAYSLRCFASADFLPSGWSRK